RRGGRVSKGLHIGLGVLLLLMTLMVLDGALAYLGHSNPIMHRVAISMFVGTLFDFIASLMTLLIAWYLKRFQLS
ncbi:MAG: hypothetical protein JW944_14160, partial [Deltaproteobacteria bacterium]|nr:hypothetical protein [Deltaproteobacteria bacterium]